MKYIRTGGLCSASAVSLGCMRMSALDEKGVDTSPSCQYAGNCRNDERSASWRNLQGGGRCLNTFGMVRNLSLGRPHVAVSKNNAFGNFV